MLPAQVTMIPLYIIFRQLGWFGTILPLVVPAFFGNALYVFLLRQFFMTIPNELSDAARIDGASELGIFLRIMVPLLKPALATVALFTFVATYRDFLGPLIYLKDQDQMTISVGLKMFLATRHFAAAGLKPAAESSKSPQRLVFSACTPGCRPSVI